MSAHSKITPRKPGDRPARLDSLKNPQPRPIPRAKQQEEPEVCPNPDCSCTDFISEDNKTLCNDCGTVVKEDDMVTDIQYGLGSVGNHVVHGKHVGADQAYNRDGDVFDRNRHMSSEELTCMKGDSTRNVSMKGFIDTIKAIDTYLTSSAPSAWHRPFTSPVNKYSNSLPLSISFRAAVPKALPRLHCILHAGLNVMAITSGC